MKQKLAKLLKQLSGSESLYSQSVLLAVNTFSGIAGKLSIFADHVDHGRTEGKTLILKHNRD